jgi:SAM-dependent methyltransferase
MTVATTGTAPVQGELWSARADDWASVHEPNMSPAYGVVLDLVHAGPGVEILEVGCGSGTALRLAADCGADVTALDAAPAFVEHARRRVPGADVRVGDLQFLPYEDESFDVVMGFNSFQYAADPMAALAEARRVLRPGGLVSALVWGPAEECELAPHLQAVGALMPPPPAGAPGPFSCSAPGALRALLEEGGFEVKAVGDAAAAFSYPDEPTALRGLTSAGPVVKAVVHAGDEAVRDAVAEAIVPNRRDDGSYRFENVWRFAIGRKT